MGNVGSDLIQIHVSDPFHPLIRLSSISAFHEIGIGTLVWLGLHSSRSKVIEGNFHHLNDRMQIQWPFIHTEPCPEKSSDFNASKTKGHEVKLKRLNENTLFQGASIADRP